MIRRFRKLVYNLGAPLPKGFDEKEYLRLNPDVATAADVDHPAPGAAHYILHGIQEDRRWSTTFSHGEIPAEFDDDLYIRSNPDLAPILQALSISPKAHWVLHGRRDGRSGWQVANDHKATNTAKHQPSERSGMASQEPVQDVRPQDVLRNGFAAESYARANADVARVVGSEEVALATHWLRHGFIEGRTAFGLKPYADRKFGQGFARRRNAITCYGFFDARSGLGTAARNYRDGLKNAGFEVETVNVTRKGGRFYTDPPISEGDRHIRASRRNKVNIFFLNADMMHLFFMDSRLHLLNDSFNIGVWFWELAYFRKDWASAFGAIDELWVSSEFCRRSIETASPVPVRILPQSIVLGQTSCLLDRSHFRLPATPFVFGCIFDVGSLVDRKNPMAAIDAFKVTFGEREDVILALKYHSAHHYPAEIRKLHAAANGASNIRFYGREFDDIENTSFKAAIDCLVSPHRSEGFGLNIAEAMLLEKPVIATDYGGSVDFVTDETGFPVKYQLCEIGKQLGPYPADAIWADPDMNDLAAKMLHVVENREERKAKGIAGRRKIEALYGETASRNKLAAHFDELEIFRPEPTYLRSLHSGVDFTYLQEPQDEVSFSVIVPVYNIEAELLTKCIESVRSQSYTNWELILHDDGSTREETLATLARYKGKDPRIKVSYGVTNLGIAGATNAAVEFSGGSFIALLDNDDELAPDALAEMERAILANEDVDLLYSDEDKIEADGRFSDHYFKPDWSPEHLESVMYLLHFLVVRRSLLLKIGGFRAKFSGAQDYDLVLRASRVARRIVHVPKVLYHWRKIEGSASATVDAKVDALDRAGEALQDHLEASGRAALVRPGLAQGLFRVRDRLPPKLPVTLVIFTDNRVADVPRRGKINLFDHFLKSILETTATDCELHILAVDNGNLTGKQKAMVSRNNGRTISYPGPRSPFNFSKKANFALSHIRTEMFVMLNDDMEVITPDWVDALMECACRPTSGVVGGRLLFTDDSIQHCGVVLGIQNHVAHVYHRQMANAIGYNGYTHVIRNYLAVTGACMATRMSVVDEIGGFDEALAIDYNDIDFCLRVYGSGYRNIYTPFAALYHFESVTASRQAPSGSEHELFMQRWRHYMIEDPYYNPNLSRTTPDFAPADLSVYR